MKPGLEHTTVLAKDLADQPESDYVLVLGDNPRYFAVDDWYADDNCISFTRRGTTTPVVVCRLRGVWTIYRRDVLETVTNEDVVKFSLEQAKKGEEKAREYREAGLLPAEEPDMKQTKMALPDPGQYL